MLVFIDESGIHKKVGHSTFALAYIETKNYNLLEKQFKQIEDKFKIRYFHWSKTVWKVKKEFIDEALKLNFKAKIALVKKSCKPSKRIRKSFIAFNCREKY